MSFEAQAWAARIPLKSPSEKAVLNALANCADQVGVCWPSMGYIAEVTAWSRRTVVSCIAKLEAAGLIEVVQQFHHYGGKKSNQYRMRMDVLAPKEPEKEGGVCATIAHTHVQPFHIPCATVAHLESPKEQSNTKSSEKPKAEPEDMRLAEWIGGLIANMGVKTRPPNLERWADDVRLMRERDQHTHREIAALFAWANKDPFWRANILSPAKLREKWMQLWLQAKFAPGAHSADPPKTCSRCAQRAIVFVSDGAFCAEHHLAWKREKEFW